MEITTYEDEYCRARIGKLKRSIDLLDAELRMDAYYPEDTKTTVNEMREKVKSIRQEPTITTAHLYNLETYFQLYRSVRKHAGV